MLSSFVEKSQYLIHDQTWHRLSLVNTTHIRQPDEDLTVVPNVDSLVAGWGKTGVNEPGSQVLKEATQALQFIFKCKNKF